MKVGPVEYSFVDMNKLPEDDQEQLTEYFHLEQGETIFALHNERFIPYSFYEKWLTKKLINESTGSNPQL